MDSKKNILHSFANENNILKAQKLPPLENDIRLNEKLLQMLRNNPDFMGQIDARTGKTCTYGKLSTDIIRCSLWLRKQGVGPGDIVAVCTDFDTATLIPFCATFFVGANLNLWYNRWSPEVSRHFAKLTRPKIMFSNERMGSILNRIFEEESIRTKIIIFGKISGLDSFDDIVKEGTLEEVENFQCYPVEDDDDALLLFSSGSTGLPKGVQHSYRGVFYNSYRLNTMFFKEGNKVSTFTSPLYWLTSPFIILASFLCLHTLVTISDPTPEDFCKAVEKYKIQSMVLGTGFLNQLFVSGLMDTCDFSSVEKIGVGGAKVRVEILKKMNNVLQNGEIFQGYGLTELGTIALLPTKGYNNYEACGKLTYDVEVKIIDLNTKKALGPNKKGEVCVKQTYMMKCYFLNPKATKEVIDEEGWLHTGDLGYYDEEANVYITERIKELIKYKGDHISPLEIENILLKHPEVLEAAVVGMPHSVDVEHALAFIVTRKNSEELRDQLFQMASVLGECKRLQKIVFVETLPKTGSMKIDRNELRKMAKVYAL